MSSGDHPISHEQSPLLPVLRKRLAQVDGDDSSSLVESQLSKKEQALSASAVGERLPYNDYTTIDWLHDLVKDSYRHRLVHGGRSVRQRCYAYFDSASGWLAAAVMGTLTACVAFAVDVSEATISDWKYGYCKRNPFVNREACCEGSNILSLPSGAETGPHCADFRTWSEDWWISFMAYGGFALLFGLISSSLTMTTKASLPAAAPGVGDKEVRDPAFSNPTAPPQGKSMYMAAGSGIPEIKTMLSGFAIPHLLTLKVLAVKAIGASFAVPTGMCLGKEGPFVHISACVGNLVSCRLGRYRNNSRKYREIMAAAVAAGMSVAFGAPIGGVLFAYEEIATYFPRKTLWRAFLCSAFAAIMLKAFNPTGTGKLILFETHYGTRYQPSHYLVFVLLGVAGGVWGGLFCKLNFKWSKWFRAYSIIKNNPVLEVFLVVLATVLIQYPNPLTRIGGDKIIKNNLVDCRDTHSSQSWICRNEARTDGRWDYVGWLVYGCLAKLVLTIITFGIKVPSGVIIPALDAGSFFGRLLGQWIGTISPGIFAMVGAGAFLAGVSKMTISLCVILFELTGELEYILPHMIAIMVAKWVSDALSDEGVYDLAQTVLGHPFLDPEHAMHLVQTQNPPHTLRMLIPPKGTMDEITVNVDISNKVPRRVLEAKLNQLKSRGLLDAGLVLLQHGGIFQGYVGQGELEFGLHDLGKFYAKDVGVRLLGEKTEVDVIQRDDEGFPLIGDTITSSEDLDLSAFVDRTPMSLCEVAPMELAVECFGKLGLRHLMVTGEGTGRLVGVVIKKRMLAYLESLH